LQHLEKALADVTPVEPEDDDGPDLLYEAGIARVEVTADTLRIEASCGKTEVPARVESRGVLFIPLREFVETMTPFYRNEESYELNADARGLWANHLLQEAYAVDYALFTDPTTAPATWQPPEVSEEDDELDFDK